MQTIGSRELKAHLGEVLRHVRERGDTYAVTHRGEIIARLVPAASLSQGADDFATLWSEMDELAEEIGRAWPKGMPAADAVNADRREL